MKTIADIELQKIKDVQFIISAVTTELHNMAYLEYFNTWENNGGMQWFFDECVEITNKVMFKEGSQYLKWLDHWIHNEDKYCKNFSEVTGETCFDWYHMNEARKEFESRYEKDECSMEQKAEHIGRILSGFKHSDDIDRTMNLAIQECQKIKDRQKELENNEKIKKVVKLIDSLDMDKESIQVVMDNYLP